MNRKEGKIVGRGGDVDRIDHVRDGDKEDKEDSREEGIHRLDESFQSDFSDIQSRTFLDANRIR